MDIKAEIHVVRSQNEVALAELQVVRALGNVGDRERAVRASGSGIYGIVRRSER